jgi:hypothetical protein
VYNIKVYPEYVTRNIILHVITEIEKLVLRRKCLLYTRVRLGINEKKKQSRYRPGVAQRVPGS